MRRLVCDNSFIWFLCRYKNCIFNSRYFLHIGTKMEQSFEKTMEDVNNAAGVVGCILTDKSGLCLGVKGNASSDSAGVIAAIADLAKKIDPSAKAPIISLQSETRQCLIHQQGPVIGAVFKETSS